MLSPMVNARSGVGHVATGRYQGAQGASSYTLHMVIVEGDKKDLNRSCSKNISKVLDQLISTF